MVSDKSLHPTLNASPSFHARGKVTCSHDWSAKTVVPEFARFVGCRVASGVLETGILFLVVDLLGQDGNVWKIITSIVVVVVNYLGSKLLVFRK